MPSCASACCFMPAQPFIHVCCQGHHPTSLQAQSMLWRGSLTVSFSTWHRLSFHRLRFKDSSAVWRYSGPDQNGRGRISCDFKAFFYQSKKSKKGWQWKLGARNPYTILCKRYARKEESINESWVIWLIWKNANQHPKAKQILLVSKLASAILSRLLTWKILWCLSFYRCLFPW